LKGNLKLQNGLKSKMFWRYCPKGNKKFNWKKGTSTKESGGRSTNYEWVED
jgi:hypothetical protein